MVSERVPMPPPLPAVPSIHPKGLYDFLVAVKETLDLREGRSGAGTLDRVVTERGLRSALGIDPKYLQPNTPTVTIPTSGSGNGYFESATIPDPPTAISVTNHLLNNKITWTNPVDMTEVSHVEIWASNDNNRSNAVLVGVETSPSETWTHTTIQVTLNYYYWIRTVTWAGIYSTWEPTEALGGYLVPASLKATINEMWDALTQNTTYKSETKFIADAFKVVQPSSIVQDWSVLTNYDTGVIVKHGDPLRYYKSTQTPNFQHQPPNATYWTDVTEAMDGDHAVFVIGTINGTPAIGINGNLFVDGLVRTVHLDAGAVTSEKISVSYLSSISTNLGTVTAGNVNLGPQISGVYTGPQVTLNNDGTFVIKSDQSGNFLHIEDDFVKVYEAGALRVQLGNLAV